MIKKKTLGYSLSSEEHSPSDLIKQAQMAENSGFSFAFISDHFHPWTSTEGQSPFVWSVIGAISQVTRSLIIGTGVTCPLIRYHPAIIAQSAATCAILLPNRIILGVGTGENLNEHIIGEGWPPIGTRQDMLREAVEIIRLLWQGGLRNYDGCYYTVQDARLYSLPDVLPPLMVAASGPKSASLSAEISDGLISTSPQKQLIDTFNKASSSPKPKIGQLTVCYDRDNAQAANIARQYWPQVVLNGPMTQELRLPSYFEQASSDATPSQVAQQIVCSNNPDDHLSAIKEYFDAGFDNVYVHQIGPHQPEFMRFYQKEIIPKIEKL